MRCRSGRRATCSIIFMRYLPFPRTRSSPPRGYSTLAFGASGVDHVCGDDLHTAAHNEFPLHAVRAAAPRKLLNMSVQALQACGMMLSIASPARAFLPALPSASVVRHASASAPTLRHHLTGNGVARRADTCPRGPRRSLVSLFAAADGAKDAAMATVQAAEEALNKAAEDAGHSSAGAGEVQAAVAAARAAARNAMESLRRAEEGRDRGQGEFTPREVRWAVDVPSLLCVHWL